MASFPTSIKSFTTRTDDVDTVFAAHINELQDEVASIETEILNGTVPTAVAVVAGETLADRNVVYVADNLSAGTPGRVYKTNAQAVITSTSAYLAGFTLASASAGGSVPVQISGVVTGLSGLTTGAVYYLSNTAGAIGTTPGTFSVPIGVAISTTELFLGYRTTPQIAVYGYAMGGYSSAAIATTDRITFSTSVTAASTVSNLSVARGYAAGVSDTSTYGYAMGGYSSAYVATTDRITFSTSVTAASTVSNLSVARDYAAGVSDGTTYGYAMGGKSSNGVALATTDRITFSTSVTAASTVSNLTPARYGAAGVSDGVTYGYAMGGYSGAYVTTTDRITFSTSVTAASTVSNLSQARQSAAGVSDGAV